MSVRLDGQTVFLEGDGRIEDAEALLQCFLSGARPSVDMAGCRSLHAAMAQLLLAFEPQIVGVPDSGFLAEILLPALGRARESASGEA